VPTRLVHLVIDAAQPARLARFWAAALPLVIISVPEAKTGKNRVHLDLATESVAHQRAEVERLLGLGAVHADIGHRDVPWVVLADPEGSEFCVLSPL
jgi:Glyoxalase-like domain